MLLVIFFRKKPLSLDVRKGFGIIDSFSLVPFYVCEQFTVLWKAYVIAEITTFLPPNNSLMMFKVTS